jgi:hypothetical protein
MRFSKHSVSFFSNLLVVHGLLFDMFDHEGGRYRPMQLLKIHLTMSIRRANQTLGNERAY